MKIQDQVYNLIQARLKRICFDTWTKAEKNRKGRLMGPLTYPADVYRLIELSSEVLDADRDQAEAIASEVTTGSIQNAYVNRWVNLSANTAVWRFKALTTKAKTYASNA